MERPALDKAQMIRLAEGMANVSADAKARLRYLLEGRATAHASKAEFRRCAKELIHDKGRLPQALRAELLEWGLIHGWGTRGQGRVTAYMQSIRWTQDEYAAIEAAAGIRDMDPSAYVRMAAMLLAEQDGERQ